MPRDYQQLDDKIFQQYFNQLTQAVAVLTFRHVCVTHPVSSSCCCTAGDLRYRVNFGPPGPPDSAVYRKTLWPAYLCAPELSPKQRLIAQGGFICRSHLTIFPLRFCGGSACRQQTTHNIDYHAVSMNNPIHNSSGEAIADRMIQCASS